MVWRVKGLQHSAFLACAQAADAQELLQALAYHSGIMSQPSCKLNVCQCARAVPHGALAPVETQVNYNVYTRACSLSCCKSALQPRICHCLQCCHECADLQRSQPVMAAQRQLPLMLLHL